MKNMWIRMLVHRAVDLFLGLLFVIGDFDFFIKNFWWSVLGSLDLVVVRWCFFIEQNLREIKWGDGRLMFNGDDQLWILGYEETCIFQRKPRDYYFFNYWRQISLVYVNFQCVNYKIASSATFRFVVRWEEIAVGFVFERNLTDGRIAIRLELMKILCLNALNCWRE